MIWYTLLSSKLANFKPFIAKNDKKKNLIKIPHMKIVKIAFFLTNFAKNIQFLAGKNFGHANFDDFH